ncbi:hypothetical protein OG226_41105 [Streptomyces sp. NBC_01261]|uniref:hypothetical protein n=1 Tax=Streptomyces sp. NBC_01261 TaxID=2903802 RepID=UPI002E303A8B|nr:hypothetical protein [Streptomyces sp. NBC_01261]
MSAPHRTSPAAARPAAGLRLTAVLQDGGWVRERDARFVQFLDQRLADVEATGCLAERKLAAGILDLSAEWQRRRELAAAGDQVHAGVEADAVGWALRCLAHSAWHNTPGWEPAFHPSATAPSVSPANVRGCVPPRWQ